MARSSWRCLDVRYAIQVSRQRRPWPSRREAPRREGLSVAHRGVCDGRAVDCQTQSVTRNVHIARKVADLSLHPLRVAQTLPFRATHPRFLLSPIDGVMLLSVRWLSALLAPTYGGSVR